MIKTQYIRLDMTPGGTPPVLFCSQYDIGRPLGMVVYNGGEAVDLSTYTCTIEATRTDGTAITVAVTTDGNIGAFTTTATMTNQADKYIAKLVIVDSAGSRVASLAFVMCITPATMDENAESIEEDRTLYQQYTEAVQTLIAEIRADLADLKNQTAQDKVELQNAISAETSARQSANQTLTENLAAEVSARQTADNALQSAISSEASTRASADASLQSQIDQMIAPSGEAPSAAEVQNARIGADGVTYSTLGEAIRANDNLNKSHLISEMYSNSLDVIGLLTKPTTTHSGITFSCNSTDETYTVTGTATGTAFVNLFNNGSAYPYGLAPGKTYHAYTYSDKVSLRIFAYVNGSAVQILNTRYNTIFTIPENSTGIIIRLNVLSGATVSETISVPKIVEVPTNQAIVDAIQRLENLTVRDIIPELPLNKNSVDDTTAGITFRWNSNRTKITVSGTASTVAYYNIYANPSVLPDGIEPGKTYQIVFTGNDVDFGVLVWTSPTDWSTLIVTKKNAEFTVPTNATGITFRLGVASGTTLSETINAPKVLNTYTNAQLAQVISMQVLARGSNANTVADGLYVCLDGYAYTNIPESVGFLESRTNANIKYQTFTAFACRDTYRRRALNGTFEAWYHVTGINDKVKLAMFGDSVTWGRDGASTGRVAETMPMVIGRYSRHIATTNYGVGSMGWLTKAGSPSMNALEKVQATDLTGFDAVSYCYGLNDPDSPMGTYLDTGTDTIMGVIYNIFQYVNATYPGMIQILIGIPNSCLHTEIGFPGWDWYRVRAGGWSDETLDAEMQKFANYYHIPYISNRQNVLNAWNITHYLPDGIHPNQAGYRLFGSRLRSQLEAILGA